MRNWRIGAATTVVALALAACGGSSSPTTASSGGGCSKIFKVGLVTDVGKLSDKSFNATSWKGVQDAQADKSLCVEGKAIESSQPTDYQKNMQSFADQNYDMVIAVGFLMADDVQAAAKANPKVKFAIVDDPALDKNGQPAAPNLTGLTFREDQAGYLAGYVAGLYSKTHVVAGVYGLDIPPVHKYRVGFEAGAKAADPSTKTLGVYQPAGPKAFNDPDWGKARAIEFFGQNADIVFGAGGNTGNGALIAAKEQGKTCIGVDVDQFVSYPDADPCLLTSAEKKLAVAVKSWVTSVVKGTVKAGNVVYDAANGGVGIAPFHNFDSKITAEQKAKIDDVAKKLAAGSITIPQS